MDYQPPAFCINSIVETDVPGLFEIDLQSRWRESPTYIVSQETTDYAAERVQLGCPPGWPNPPQP